MAPDWHPDSARIDQAYAWAVRVRDDDFADWEAFGDWIEADPRNLDAYNEAVDADARLPDLLAMPGPGPSRIAANDDRPRRWTWLAGGGLVAAGLALAVVLNLPGLSGGGATVIATGPGERREIALANGDMVVLNGDTRLVIDPASPRGATLEQGQALFSIRHDPAHPFEVKAGGHRLVDAGTRFDVVREGGVTKVAVSEGLVVYEPDTAALRLEPGSALSVRDGAGKPVLSQVRTDGVGGWNRGMLAYLDAPIDTVAADLSRSLGAPVRLSASPDKYSLFTGTLSINGDPKEVLPRLAPLIGVTLRQDGKGWEISPRDR